jgi:hypothetical protein
VDSSYSFSFLCWKKLSFEEADGFEATSVEGEGQAIEITKQNGCLIHVKGELLDDRGG